VSHPVRIRPLALSFAVLALLPATVLASTGGASPGGAAAPAAPAAAVRASGGAAPGTAVKPQRRHRVRRRARRVPVQATVAPPALATLLDDGTTSPPAGAPAEVAAVIAAGNRIASLPYVYGGGHQSFHASGYDCSGSVSYVLHAIGRLGRPRDSGELMSYGAAGRGRHITVYANAGHAFMVVDGRRFDTTDRAQDGSRWHASMRSTAGYVARHPPGL
jgi:cell wall-associated NlpC family hydrolase